MDIKIPPDDEHNRALVSNVHPADWRAPDPAPRYHLVVVGAGTAGLVTAAGAAGLGAKVALVERHLMGGDCLNVGCVPSKALIRASRACAEVRDAGSYGVVVPPGARVDFPRVMERMRKLRAGLSPHDSARRFRELGVDVFLGEARFTGPDALEAGGKTLRFAKAVIATGARAAIPPIPGIEKAGYLTNETVFSLTSLPTRLAVIGGGPIGCELAQAFARFGSKVVILQSAPQILHREDPDAALRVQAALTKDGVEIVTGCSIASVEWRGGEKVIRVESGGGARELVCDEVLVGVGRAPNVEGLGLEAAGVHYDLKAGIRADDFLRTTNPRIYSAGDSCMAHKFTHAADAAASIVIQNALFLGRKRLSALVIPWCTYTDPEIAHVGIYEEEARARGLKVRTFVQELSGVDRALLDGEAEGLVKVHVQEGTDRILGATIVARHAGEMISELTLAMVAGAGLGTLAGTIHPYPTQAEAIKKAADAWNKSRLTAPARKLLVLWLGRP